MKKFLRNNGILLIIIAVLLAAVLGIGASILGYDPVSSILNAVGAPFRAISTAVTNWTEDLYDRSFRYDEALLENEQLKQQVAELERAAREGQSALAENERLRDLLGLSNQRPELAYLDAAVTERSSTNWGSDLTLNRGTSDGAAAGDCVIDQYGNLVGVITEIGPNWALVTTILDPSTELGGRIDRVDESAILSGDFTLMTQGLLKLTYLPSDSLMVTGDKITTSGLGGLYPEGLTVGSVRSLHTEANGFTQYAVVAPDADVNHVRYVFIITDF